MFYILDVAVFDYSFNFKQSFFTPFVPNRFQRFAYIIRTHSTTTNISFKNPPIIFSARLTSHFIFFLEFLFRFFSFVEYQTLVISLHSISIIHESYRHPLARSKAASQFTTNLRWVRETNNYQSGCTSWTARLNARCWWIQDGLRGCGWLGFAIKDELDERTPTQL